MQPAYYAFYDLATGHVLQHGTCPPDWLADQTPPEGCGRFDGKAYAGRHVIQNGQRRARRPTAPEKRAAAAEATRQARAAAYPAVTEQLDVLWRQIAALPPELLTADAHAMLDRIAAVKQHHPKEST